MIVHRRPILLLIFALLASQWIYAAHSHYHGDALDSDHLCQLCLHSGQFDAFAPVVACALPTLTLDRTFNSQVSTTCPTLHIRYHDPRAPPRS